MAVAAQLPRPITVLQVQSPTSGRVRGCVGPNPPNTASSTCSRKRPAASASTTYPMATRRVFVMGQPKRLAGQPGLEPGTCGFGDRRSTIGATGLGGRLLRLLVLRMLAATGAELRQDQLVGHGPLVLRGGVVPLPADRALQGDDRAVHLVCSSLGAHNQN